MRSDTESNPSLKIKDSPYMGNRGGATLLIVYHIATASFQYAHRVLKSTLVLVVALE